MALGKGLQSLIPKKTSNSGFLNRSRVGSKPWLNPRKESVFNVEISKIKPNPFQPRRDFIKENLEELANSIREHGILQPLLVNKIEKSTIRGRKVEYQLMAGERRWRAAKMAGLPHVPVIIRDNSKQQKLEIALVENIQRDNLNPIEEALAFRQLQKEFNLKHDEIAQKMGKSRVAIVNCIRLLNLPPKIQKDIANGRLTTGHGRALLIAKQDKQIALAQEAIENSLSVREMEDMARKVAARTPMGGKEAKNPFFRKMEKDLQLVLNNRVNITKRGRAGRLILQFHNQEELDKLVKYLLRI